MSDVGTGTQYVGCGDSYLSGVRKDICLMWGQMCLMGEQVHYMSDVETGTVLNMANVGQLYGWRGDIYI